MAVDLRKFRYFVAVAEERHFGRAATQLHIAQSGLSQQILNSNAVGVQLLVRNRRGVEVTEAGETFLDYARLTLELADRAVESAQPGAREEGAPRVGTTAIGMPPKAERLQTFGERSRTWMRFHPGYLRAHRRDHHVRPRRRNRLRPLQVGGSPAPISGARAYEFVAAVPEGHRLAKLERVPRAELLKEPFPDAPRNINPS